jgi:hypothetical protein
MGQVSEPSPVGTPEPEIFTLKLGFQLWQTTPERSTPQIKWKYRIVRAVDGFTFIPGTFSYPSTSVSIDCFLPLFGEAGKQANLEAF